MTDPASSAPPPATRVMVVDDHPIWREAVAADLAARGVDVVATAADGAAAVRIAPAVRPTVVLLDLQMPGPSGVETIATLRDAVPDARVLVLSASAEEGDVLAAVTAGARGYLTKSASAEDLLDAVVRTAQDLAVFSPGLAGLVLGEFRRRARHDPGPTGEDGVHRPALTPRETEILRLVATGLTARAIAARLTLSHRTVENHVQHVLGKLQLTNRVELTRWALDHGLDES